MSLQSVVACRSVKDFSDPALDLIERTYTESFPEVERRDFSLDGYTYVEHFAIDPAARNGGIGAEAMKQFLVFCGTPVVLEVEMPTDEMSKRRIGFYERLGFKLDNQVYHQPPYREGGEWLEMRLMTYGDVDLEHSFELVKNCLHKNVYGVKDGLTR